MVALSHGSQFVRRIHFSDMEPWNVVQIVGTFQLTGVECLHTFVHDAHITYILMLRS